MFSNDTVTITSQVEQMDFFFNPLINHSILMENPTETFVEVRTRFKQIDPSGEEDAAMILRSPS